jgi:RNA polymerase sigma factor (sigma-70 family)
MLNLTRNLAIDKTRSREMGAARKTGRLEKLVSSKNEETVVQGEDFIGLAEVLKGLPQEQRLVVEYLYLKGYTQSELADESGIPLGTIKTRLRLAMNTLRTLLKVK